MRERPRAFLFDCDGTLFETESLKARSWGVGMVRYLRDRGDFPEEELKRVEEEVSAMYQAGGTRDKAAHDILKRCEGRFSPEIDRIIRSMDVNQLIALRLAARDEILDKAFPRTGPSGNGGSSQAIRPVWALAVAAKRQGYPVALVTNAEREWVERYFHASGFEDHQGNTVDSPERFFGVAVCGKEKGIGVKEAVCRVLGRLSPGEAPGDDEIEAVFSGIPAEEVRCFIIVEDSADGVKAARSTGVRAIAVPNHFTRNDFPHLMLSYAQLAEMSLGQVVDALEQLQGADGHPSVNGAAGMQRKVSGIQSQGTGFRRMDKGRQGKTATREAPGRARKREELGT